jgi:putative nucleotidyltransferase with HDIG domain
MKRILLVGDESLAFEQLQKTLPPQDGEWELSFTPDGPSALVLLEATLFDAIVSDNRTPKMDGAALLKVVCERFPRVVRILLSSQNELEGALRAVPVAHQFLLKPCDPRTLRVAIERATSLSIVLNDRLLAGMVGSVRDLPVLPRTYLDLRDALTNSNGSLKRIVRIVEQDVGVSAKILQLVNSAFFGLSRQISSVHVAVCILGTEMLQNLVLSAEVFHVFEKAKALKGFSFEDLHMHSQLTAKIAGRISTSAFIRSTAAMAGLLHDIGKLVLATRSPQQFAQALAAAKEGKIPLFAAEQSLLGVSHAEVGAHLLGLWGLPSPVAEAVAHHHHPRRIPHDALDAVGVVHIANALAHEHPVYPPSGEVLPSQGVDAGFVEDLRITDQIRTWKEIAASAARELRSVASAAR